MYVKVLVIHYLLWFRSRKISL